MKTQVIISIVAAFCLLSPIILYSVFRRRRLSVGALANGQTGPAIDDALRQQVSEPHQNESSDNERGRRFSTWFTAGLGVLAIALSGGLWVEERQFVAMALRAEGTVTQVRPPSDPKRGHSIVRYHVDGQAFEIEYEFASDRDETAARANQKVTVLYPKDRPDKGGVEGSPTRTYMVMTFGIVSVVAFALSAICFFAPGLGKREESKHRDTENTEL